MPCGGDAWGGAGAAVGGGELAGQTGDGLDGGGAYERVAGGVVFDAIGDAIAVWVGAEAGDGWVGDAWEGGEGPCVVADWAAAWVGAEVIVLAEEGGVDIGEGDFGPDGGEAGDVRAGGEVEALGGGETDEGFVYAFVAEVGEADGVDEIGWVDWAAVEGVGIVAVVGDVAGDEGGDGAAWGRVGGGVVGEDDGAARRKDGSAGGGDDETGEEDGLAGGTGGSAGVFIVFGVLVGPAHERPAGEVDFGVAGVGDFEEFGVTGALVVLGEADFGGWGEFGQFDGVGEDRAGAGGVADAEVERFGAGAAGEERAGRRGVGLPCGTGEVGVVGDLELEGIAAAGGIGEDDTWGGGGCGVGGDGEGVEDRGEDVWFEREVPWVGGGGAGDVGEDFVGGPDGGEVGDLGADVEGPAFFGIEAVEGFVLAVVTGEGDGVEDVFREVGIGGVEDDGVVAVEIDDLLA